MHVRVLIAATAGALLAAGCASTMPVGGGAAAPTTAPTGRPSPYPPAAAAADAAALLAAFTPPPGATASAAEPDGTPSALNTTPLGQSSPQEVLRTGWWVVATPPRATVAWLVAHVPHGATLAGIAQGSAYRNVEYAEPSNAEASERDVAASVAALPGNRSVLRVDVVELYRPAKPAAEVVPVTRLLNVAVLSGGSPVIHASSRTVTDGATIARVAAIINALPTLPDAAIACANDNGAAIDLVFWNSGEGAMLARVRVPLSGCADRVSVTVGGNRQPLLDGGASSPAAGVSHQLATLLGLTV